MATIYHMSNVLFLVEKSIGQSSHQWLRNIRHISLRYLRAQRLRSVYRGQESALQADEQVIHQTKDHRQMEKKNRRPELWAPFKELEKPEKEQPKWDTKQIINSMLTRDKLLKKWRPVTHDNQFDRLAEVMTPLAHIPYQQQQKLKYTKSKRVLEVLSKKLENQAKGIRVECYLKKLRPSPVTEAYRNKDEFNVRTGIDGNPKTVGFYVGSPARGTVVCVPGDKLVNVRQSHLEVAKAYQEYIRGSELRVCEQFSDGGHWRSLTVRSSRKDCLMASIILHPQDLPLERIDEERDRLTDFFTSGPGASCPLTSLFLQTCRHTRCSADVAPYQLLFGDPHMLEELNGRIFRISPDSFFQVNTSAAEVLYRTIGEVASLSANTTLLDVCSGTGSISLTLADRVNSCIGIEVTSNAVKDARENARINNIHNAEFICGRAEKVMCDIHEDLEMCPNLVAIVNPVRGGLHREVVRALRQCESIQKLVYVSCKPEGAAMTDFMQLCADKGDSLQFLPTIAIPIDLFPHTDHCELVILFERST